MSLISELRNAQAALEAAAARFEALQANPEVAQLKAFEDELRALLAKYGRSLKDVNQLLDPQWVAPGEKKAPISRNRRLRRYTHPETGEVVETTGGLTNTLKEWKAKYGWETVSSWCSFV